MKSPTRGKQAKSFFTLQVCNRSVKRLTKEITERMEEVKTVKATYDKAKQGKADKSVLKRAKDDLDECEKTLKVTVIALGKAAEEAETFVKATYQYELQSVMENPSSAADEASSEICDLIRSLNECVSVCPEHSAKLELVSTKKTSAKPSPKMSPHPKMSPQPSPKMSAQPSEKLSAQPSEKMSAQPSQVVQNASSVEPLPSANLEIFAQDAFV